MSIFKIRKGMVFYLEEPHKNQTGIQNLNSRMPKKNRPYIVLSNNFCNEYAENIHVAPLYTPSSSITEKPYRVSFTGYNGRESNIDIGMIILIPKEMCTEANYSEAISRYIVGNKELMESISKAIMHQFDVDTTETAFEETAPITFEAESPVIQEETETAPIQTAIPQINLTINISGIPVTASNSIQNGNNVEIELTPANTETKEIAETVEETPEIIEVSIGQPEKMRGRPTIQRQKEIEEFIMQNCDKFGGSMTAQEISEHLVLNVKTVNKYIKRLSPPVRKKNTFTDAMWRKFIRDYESAATPEAKREMLKKYRKYGYTTTKQLSDSYRHKKQRMTAVCTKK